MEIEDIKDKLDEMEEDFKETNEKLKNDTRTKRIFLQDLYRKANTFLASNIIVIFFIFTIGVISLNNTLEIKDITEVQKVEKQKPIEAQKIKGNDFKINLDKVFVSKSELRELKNEAGEVVDKIFIVWYREKEEGSSYFFTLKESIDNLNWNKQEYTTYLLNQSREVVKQ